MAITTNDLEHLDQAVNLAREAQKLQNLPIGALIVLENKVIAEGKNSIWVPRYRPNRHAEIEAIEMVPSELWRRASKMTLYTTLEPCMMCLGTILVHRIGRIVYGSKDIHGGALCVFGHMPKAFETLLQSTTWEGPAMPEKCDELSKMVIAMSLSHKKREKEQTSSLWDIVLSDEKNG